MLSALLGVPWSGYGLLSSFCAFPDIIYSIYLNCCIIRKYWKKAALLIFSMCLLSFIYMVFLILPWIIAFIVTFLYKKKYTETAVKFHKTWAHLRKTQKKKNKEKDTRQRANRRRRWPGREEGGRKDKRNLKTATLESTKKRHPFHCYGGILQNFCA